MQLSVTGKQIDIGETLQTHERGAFATSTPKHIAGPPGLLGASLMRHRRHKRQLRNRRGHRDMAVEIMAARQYVLADADTAQIYDEVYAGGFGGRGIVAGRMTGRSSLTGSEAGMQTDLDQSESTGNRHGGLDIVDRRPDRDIGRADPREDRGTL